MRRKNLLLCFAKYLVGHPVPCSGKGYKAIDFMGVLWYLNSAFLGRVCMLYTI